MGTPVNETTFPRASECSRWNVDGCSDVGPFITDDYTGHGLGTGEVSLMGTNGKWQIVYK